jgi:hypothetical protein
MYYLIYLHNTYGTFSLLFFIDASLSRARLTPKMPPKDLANWTANPGDITNVLQFLHSQKRRAGQGGNFDKTVFSEAAAYMAKEEHCQPSSLFGPPLVSLFSSCHSLLLTQTRPTRRKRVKMAPELGAGSKHTPADQEYLYSLSARLLMEFRNYVRGRRRVWTGILMR